MDLGSAIPGATLVSDLDGHAKSVRHPVVLAVSAHRLDVQLDDGHVLAQGTIGGQLGDQLIAEVGPELGLERRRGWGLLAAGPEKNQHLRTDWNQSSNIKKKSF